MESWLDAGSLAGLLADEARRRCVAALVLGATTVETMQAASGLDSRTATTALARLASAGLVVRGDDGTLVLLGQAFALAAREAAARRRPPLEPAGDAPTEVTRVLRAFVRDGRLVQIPSQHAKRRVILEILAQEFEPGRRYSEASVNLTLGKWHADTAALRRYLVDEGFLDREDRQYWRTGGPVDLDP
jgi:hypothetical protein